MSSTRRNIVLITLDSLRADHCSFMGYHRKTTPTMNKMTKRGLYFENAIAPTLPTAPSMFCIFTGSEYMIPFDILSARERRKEFNKRVTLADVLQAYGYYTVAIHANPWVSRVHGFNKGFKYFQDYLSTNFSPNIIGQIKALIRKEASFTNWEVMWPEIINITKKLRELKKPYFLWILLLDTHIPYIPPKNFRKYSSKSTLLLLYLNFKLKRNDKYFRNKKIKFFYKISLKERERLINAYDDCIRYADEFIRRLWEELKDDDPIFIIHGDHGDGFCEHGFFYHPAMLYEELIHVPLMIYNADIKGKIDYPISLSGLASTILELINIESKFPSKSFLNEENIEKGFVISKVFEDGIKRRIAIRMKNWKFIIGQKEEDELYNLKKDPYEQENIIDEYPDLAKELKEIVRINIKRELKIRQIQKVITNLRFK